MSHGNRSCALVRAGVVCLAGLVVGVASGAANSPPVGAYAEPDEHQEDKLCELRRKLGLPCDLSNTAPMEEYYRAVEEAYLQADFDRLSNDEQYGLILQILVVQESQTPMPDKVDPDAYWRFMDLLDHMLLELEA